MPTLPSSLSPSPPPPPPPPLPPKKSLYAPLTPSPLNPNFSLHQPAAYRPQQQQQQQYPPKQNTTSSSSSKRRRPPGPRLATSHPGHKYAALAQASPGQRLLRQKAALAWRSETLRHHLLLLRAQPPAPDASEDRFAPPAPTPRARGWSCRCRWLPRGPAHLAVGGGCVAGGCGGGVEVGEGVGAEKISGVDVAAVDAGGGMGVGVAATPAGFARKTADRVRIQKALEQAGYTDRWRPGLVVPVPFDGEEDENGDGSGDSGADDRGGVNVEDGRENAEAAEAVDDRESDVFAASASPSQVVPACNGMDKPGDGGAPGDGYAGCGIGGGDPSDFEVAPDVGLLGPHRGLFAAGDGASGDRRGKRLGVALRRVTVVVAVVIGMGLAHGLVVAFGSGGGAGGRAFAAGNRARTGDGSAG